MAPGSATSSDTISGPPAPPSSLVEFNNTASINWRMFPRDTDTNLELRTWEPLYWSHIQVNGDPLANLGLMYWLSRLPVDAPEPLLTHMDVFLDESSLIEVAARQAWDHRAALYERAHGRPRSTSAPPTSPPHTPAPGQTNTSTANTTAAHPHTPGMQNMDPMADAPGLEHPNPLGQHPVRHAQVTQPVIPQRFSSLLFQPSNSQLVNNPTTSPAGEAPVPQQSIINRFQALHLGDRFGRKTSAHAQTANTTNMNAANASNAPNTANIDTANMNSHEDEVKRVSGPGTSDKPKEKKRARSIVSTSIILLLQMRAEMHAFSCI